MRTSDLWLILVGLLVLGLTAATLAYLEAKEDRVDFTFVAGEAALGESSSPVDESGATLNWTLPINATEATIELLVSFTGQSLQGGSATLQAQLVGPDGTAGPIDRTAFTIGQGATSANTNVTLTLRWMDVPRDTTASSHGFDRSARWDEPLTLIVVVQEPGDLPAASYTFTARAAGAVATFAHSLA